MIVLHGLEQSFWAHFAHDILPVMPLTCDVTVCVYVYEREKAEEKEKEKKKRYHYMMIEREDWREILQSQEKKLMCRKSKVT